MSKDPYEALGVGKDASQADIRKAYRDLAKKLHPDLNPGDKEAEERFKGISAAYAILGDAEKKAQFDSGEIDASGAERPDQQFYRRYADADGWHHYQSSAGHEDFADIGDIFADLYARQRTGGAGGAGQTFRMRGGDARYHMTVDFLEAVKGAKKRVTMPDGATLDVSIPAGVRDGQTLRLKGKGHPGIGGGPPGDALVQIEVSPHPLYTREGRDILIELPVALNEAVLGASVEVPTISGRVKMSVPKGASSGDTLRLRGKGIHEKGSKTKGDQLVRLKVVLPDTIDPELEAFMKEWSERHAFDPRADLKVTS